MFLVIAKNKNNTGSDCIIENQLNSDTDRFSAAAESAGIGIWEYDLETKTIIQLSESKYFEGYGRIIRNVPEALVKDGYIDPDSAESFIKMHRDLVFGVSKTDGVFKIRSGDKKLIYAHIVYTNLFRGDGSPYRAVGVSQDITGEYEARQNCELEKQLQRCLAPDIIAYGLHDITKWSVVRSESNDPLECEFSGTDVTEALLFVASRVAEDDCIKSYLLSLSSELIEGKFKYGQNPISFEYLRIMADGSTHWVRDESNLFVNPDNGHLMMLLFCRDIDKRKRQMDELSLEAETDSMTGFLDHSATMKHLDRYISSEGDTGTHAIFMIDVDNFKNVNDRLGHQIGDGVIREISAAIRRLFRTTDILGRIGGDEFLVLMKNISDTASVLEKADELIDSLQFDCTSGETTVVLSGSVGISIFEGNSKTVDELYFEADSALYRAKNTGKNHYSIYGADYAVASGILKTQFIAGCSETVSLHTLLENMSGSLLLAEIGDKIEITYATPGYLKTMNYKKREIQRHKDLPFSAVHPDDLPSLKAALKKAAETGQVHDRVYRVTIQGSLRWHHMRASRLPVSRDGKTKVICLIMDIPDVCTKYLFDKLPK